ncbi:glycerate kinase type-2 family protein [Haliangium sp.]|uniref:glycerate kinase type-2 family protein n=1 Tax=Haliangium sp. TaxID=2663208 RepID=UPI003D0B3606
MSARRLARRRFLERLFLSTVTRLNPSQRTSEVLAEADWKPGRTVIVAAGKAALSMSSGAMAYLAARDLALGGGLVVVPEQTLGASVPSGREQPGTDSATGPRPADEGEGAADDGERDGAESEADESSDVGLPVVCAGDYPVPLQRSLLAARAACRVVSQAPPDAEILALLSGGASALMAMPAAGISLADKNAVVSGVAAAGANRRTVNLVRKHLSDIKGGRLAKLAPVPVATLIASDVVGDDLTAVGSGPTLPDRSTVREACDVVAASVGWGAVPWRVRSHFEAALAGARPDTLRHPRPGDRVALLAGTGALVDVAVEVATAAGLEARAFARDVVADVDQVAEHVAVLVRRIAAAGAARALCFAGGGEPSIRLGPSPGVGGRAQHLALLVAREIAGIGGVSVLVAASDGIDGNSQAAGAVVDGDTWDCIRARGYDPERALAGHDAGTVLAAVDATMVTGITEIKHGDLVLVATGI